MMRIDVIGLSDVQDLFAALPEVATQSAVFAINDTTERFALPAVRKEMREQINFPSGYLEGDRLRVGRRATKGSLESSIRGRDRATSLARFAEGQTPANTRGRGVRVEVKRGQRQTLRNAFLVDLKNGNRGLAVRLKPGEKPRNTDKAVQLANNVFLLYGPSVDQVFTGVAEDVSPAIGRALSKQFLRQFARLTRG